MKLLFIAFLSLILVTGCKTSKDSNTEVLETNIISITSPENAIVGDNVKIKVHFVGINGCAQPYSIEADKVGQTIKIRAFYSLPEDGICTDALTDLSLDYTYFADLPGPYFFTSSSDNTISDTLVVQ